MKLLIILAISLAAFSAEPQPAKQPVSMEQFQKTIEQLQKQVAADKAEIARKDQVIAALREQMQALSAYFSAQEKIRALETKPTTSAVSTSDPSAKQ